MADAIADSHQGTTAFQTANVREAHHIVEALSEIYGALRVPVCRYLASLLGDTTEAEDLAQEAFVRLFQEFRQGRRVSNPRTWVFHVAYNLAMDRFRAREAVQTGGLDLVDQRQLAQAANSHELAVESERQRQLNERLLKLSERERQCLELRAEGLRYREIGEILGIAIPTVQTLLGRAIGKLKGTEV